MSTELETFYQMVEEIEVAMMTTRRADGHLRSRAMATQKRALGADLWFVAAVDSGKVEEIEHDAHVNLAYCNNSTREWISVSGVAALSRDRQKIAELYSSDWKMWFGAGGDPRDGTPDDPRIVLIGVTMHAVEFLEVNKSKPVVMYELIQGWLTGSEPDLGTMHELGKADPTF